MELDKLIDDENAFNQLIDDAVSGAEDAFAQRGIQLDEAQLFALGDYLSLTASEFIDALALLRKITNPKE